MIDVTSIEQTLVGLAATAISVMGGIALAALQKRFSILNNTATTEAFDGALQKSLTMAATQVNGLIAEKGYDHVDVKSAVLEAGLDVIVQKFPDALAQMGLSGDDARPTIAAALQRALPQVMAAYAASPATPPATTSPPVNNPK